jgi:hypothetical protein
VYFRVSLFSAAEMCCFSYKDYVFYAKQGQAIVMYSELKPGCGLFHVTSLFGIWKQPKSAKSVPRLGYKRSTLRMRTRPVTGER